MDDSDDSSDEGENDGAANDDDSEQPKTATDGDEAMEGDAGPAATEGSKRRKKSTLETFSEEYLDGVDTEKIEYEITVMEEKLGKKKHNAKAIRDYYEKEKEYVNFDLYLPPLSVCFKCCARKRPLTMHRYADMCSIAIVLERPCFTGTLPRPMSSKRSRSDATHSRPSTRSCVRKGWMRSLLDSRSSAPSSRRCT